MKYTDDILMIAAAYSLYTLVVTFSNQYFVGINQLIPDIFSDNVSINISSTFHQVIGSVITGMLLVRFASKPVLIALLVAVAINVESYILLATKYSYQNTLDYYLANPTQILNLVKPLVLLPCLTYLLGLLKRYKPPEDHSSN